MNHSDYTIAQLVDDLRRIQRTATDERDLLRQVRPLALAAAAARHTWLSEKHYSAGQAQGFGAHMLHEEPDHSLAVMDFAWLPARGAPPHDHGTWAVIAGVDGPERNDFYQRSDDGLQPGRAELRKVGESICAAGDAVAMPSGMIHGVWNDGDRVSVSLHIYGRHINHTLRSQYDIERKTASPFIVAMES
jgi:predicted metal-dependent enzyme (double-stranded beta helix superfamily)